MARGNDGRYRPKYGPNEDRTCPRCERTLSADEFYAKIRYEDGSVRIRQTLCKECSRERQRELRGHKPQRKMTKGEKQRKRRLHYLRASRDPERAEARRAAKREQARKRRERAKTDAETAERMRAASERYRQKYMSDPEAHAMRLIDQRIRYRAKHPTKQIQTTAFEAFDDAHDWVDSEPFLSYLKATFGAVETRDLEGYLKIDSSRFDRLMEQKRVSLSVVDYVLTAGLGRPDLLNALYPMEGDL